MILMKLFQLVNQCTRRWFNYWKCERKPLSWFWWCPCYLVL